MDAIELTVAIIGVVVSIIATYILTIHLKKKEETRREISEIRDMIKGQNEVLQTLSTSLMIKSSLGDYEKRFERVEQGITRMEGTIKDSGSGYKVLEKNITSLEGNIKELEAKIRLDLGTIQKGVTDFRDNIIELNEKVAKLENLGKTQEGDIGQLIEEITDIKENTDVIQTAIHTLTTNLANINGVVQKLKSEAHRHPSGLVGERIFK